MICAINERSVVIAPVARPKLTINIKYGRLWYSFFTPTINESVSMAADALGGVGGSSLTNSSVSIMPNIAGIAKIQNIVFTSDGAETMAGASTLASASPSGSAAVPIILAVARSFSPNQVATNNVGQLRTTELANPAMIMPRKLRPRAVWWC